MQMEAEHVTARRQVRDTVGLPATGMAQGISGNDYRVSASEPAHPPAFAVQNLHADRTARGIGVQLDRKSVV